MKKSFPTHSFLRKVTAFVLTFLLFHHFSYSQTWSILGNENQVSSVASYYTTIAVVGDVPYVAYVEGASSGGTGKVKRRNPATGSWEQVGGDIAATPGAGLLSH